MGKIEIVGGGTYDFGTMKQGSHRTHKFVFKNVGGSPVYLEFLSSTCKCTVGKFKNATLQPGQETEVELDWYAEKGLIDFAQSATVASDVVGQEEIKVTIKGKIGSSYVFDPPEKDFGDFLASQENSFEGKLYSFEESPLKIAAGDWSVPSQMKDVAVVIGSIRKLEPGEIKEHSDARQVMDFTVKLKRGISSGRFGGNIVFKQSLAENDSEPITFAMRGRSVTIVTVVAGNNYDEEKNTLSLGTASSKDGIKKSFLLKVKSEDGDNAKPVKVNIGAVTPEAAREVLKVSIGEPIVSETQKLFPITLEIPPGSPPCEMAGAFGKDFAKIVLETDIGSVPMFPMFIKFRITE